MALNRKEKEESVIKLLNEGKTTREIAQIAHASLRDIGLIARKVTSDDSLADDDLDLVHKVKLKDKSYRVQSFQMFKENTSLVDVAIGLDLSNDEVQAFYSDYLQLINRYQLTNIYLELKNDFPLFVYLYRRIKEENLSKQDINALLENQNKLKEMEIQVTAANNLLANLKLHKLQLEQEIREKQHLLNR